MIPSGSLNYTSTTYQLHFSYSISDIASDNVDWRTAKTRPAISLHTIAPSNFSNWDRKKTRHHIPSLYGITDKLRSDSETVFYNLKTAQNFVNTNYAIKSYPVSKLHITYN